MTEINIDEFISEPKKEQSRKKTLGQIADLLERNHIDIDDIGNVQKLSLWQGFYKDKEGDANTVDLTGITISPKFAEGPKWPVVDQAPSVKIKYSSATPKSRANSDFLRAVVLPDIQIGYWIDEDGELQPCHDEQALSVAYQVMKDARPDKIVNVGDNIDMPEFSKYRLHNAFQKTMQASIDRASTHGAYCRSILGPDGEIIWLEGNHECLSMDHNLVTRRGFISFDNLLPSDEVLSVNDDGSSVWVLANKRIRKEYSGDMINISSRYIDSLTTPDHRIVGKSVNSNRWQEKLAKNVTSAFKVVTGGTGSNIDSDLSDKEILLSAWCHTDSYCDKGKWVFYQSEPKQVRIKSLLQGINYKETLKIRDTKEICGKILKKAPQPSYEYRVNDMDVNNLLSELVSDKNRLSDWVWKLSERQVDLFISELQYTDGTTPTKSVKSKVIYCSREGLRHELMSLMSANGYRTSETEYSPGYWRINITKTLTAKIDFSHAAGRNRNVKNQAIKNYSGDVWCLSVPQGRFFVERSGKVFLTGNCRLSNYVIDNARAAFGLKQGNIPKSWPVLSVPHLCRFDESKVTYLSGYPANSYWINNRLRVIHGNKVSQNSTAHAYLANERVSIIYGHIHRREWAERTFISDSGQPRTILAASPGCLARIDGAVPSTKNGYDVSGQPVLDSYAENWQQGLAIVDFKEGDGPFVYQQIAIHSEDGVKWAQFNDKIYESE